MSQQLRTSVSRRSRAQVSAIKGRQGQRQLERVWFWVADRADSRAGQLSAGAPTVPFHYFFAVASTSSVVIDKPSLCISALTTPPGIWSLVQVLITMPSRVSSET